MRPETLLAGLPRLVRIADEARWRSHAALATTIVVGLFWAAGWLVGEPVRPGPTALAAAAVALPTLLVARFAAPTRILRSLDRAVPPPAATLRETSAATRERRMRLSGIVLTGIVALLLFDHFTDQGRIMAGLVAGLFGALAITDGIEARRWETAEQRRETRILVIVAPYGLTPSIGPERVYEVPRPGGGDPSPRSDLGV